MKAQLGCLVEGCIDAHVNSATTKDAAKLFRALIAHAYELGVRDEKEEQRKLKESQDNQESSSSNESCNEKETCLFKEESSEEASSKSQSIAKSQKQKDEEKRSAGSSASNAY